MALSFCTMKRFKWKLHRVKSAMVPKTQPIWYDKMERVIFPLKIGGMVATRLNVASNWNKPRPKYRQLNLQPSASLLTKQKTNGRNAMANKFLKRTLFLTVALTD